MVVNATGSCGARLIVATFPAVITGHARQPAASPGCESREWLGQQQWQ
jgi:hypothetical protein